MVSLDLSDTGFAVFDSNAAVLILGIACIAEFGAYYVPWLDNLLDTIASPAAVLSGIGMTSMVLVGSDPIMQWSFAIIAGGGSRNYSSNDCRGERSIVDTNVRIWKQYCCIG